MIEGGRSKCGGVCWRRVGFAIARRAGVRVDLCGGAFPLPAFSIYSTFKRRCTITGRCDTFPKTGDCFLRGFTDLLWRQYDPDICCYLARRMDESINISVVAIPDTSTIGAYRHKPHPHRWPKPVKTLYQLVRPDLMFQVPNTVRHPTLSTPPPLYPRRRIQTAAEQPDSGGQRRMPLRRNWATGRQGP